MTSLQKYHTSESCFNNVMSIAGLFGKLWFVVHPANSAVIPTQKIVIKEFVVNSGKISTKLAPQKENNLKILVNQLFSR